MNLSRFSTEGYIIIATNKQQWLEIALNCALSIRLKDKRPIALLHDKSVNIPEGYKKYFNHFISLPQEEQLGGALNKLLLFKYSPFKRTMYIDSDCLMIKNDISIIWNRLRRYHFTTQGNKMFEGERWGLDLKKTIKDFALMHIVKFDGGVIYFDKSEVSRKVFDKAREFMAPGKTALTISFRGTLAEEPLFGCAMGYYGLEGFPIVFRHWLETKQWIQRCSSKAIKVDIDVLKGRGSIVYGNNHSDNPTIAHFVGFCNPIDIYIREANKLRKHFGIPIISAESIEHRGEHRAY